MRIALTLTLTLLFGLAATSAAGEIPRAVTKACDLTLRDVVDV